MTKSKSVTTTCMRLCQIIDMKIVRPLVTAIFSVTICMFSFSYRINYLILNNINHLNSIMSLNPAADANETMAKLLALENRTGYSEF